MSGSDSRDVFLEVTDAPPRPPPEAAPSPADTRHGPYLEPASAPEDPPAESAPSKRKKVRADERGQSAADQASLAIVAALQSDVALMRALWPDVAAVELIRTPPPEEAFAARCDFARRAIDAVARRDAESRARAEVAQRALQRKLDALAATGAELRDAALAELRRAQVAELMAALKDIGGGTKVFYAAEVTRLVAAAESRGIDAEAAKHLAVEQGYELAESSVRTWTALDALPGAPSTMDAAALALLQHPAQGAEAVRGGAVLAWLRANSASPELQQKSRDCRMIAERGGSGALAVHSQAWALGRKDLVLGAAWLRTPGEIAPAVRGGTVTLDDLARASRDGTLPAWLRLQGWIPAAGAADLVARGEPMGLKRLAWSLGEPLVVGDQGVGDPATLARVVLSRPELRDALTGLFASGDLLAWLESLPPVLRDEQWADRLRRAREDRTKAADTLPLWMGVYGHARAGVLTALDGSGTPTSLTSVSQLRVTAQVSEVWDSLKTALRTGELLAWLSVVAPEVELPKLPRPPKDEDGELNTLLWSLGHTGMVLEWGPHDLPVASMQDVVRAYQRSWQQLESQAARGYVFDWIHRFHGTAVVLPAVDASGPVLVRDVVAWLRAEVGRLPAGHVALKLATLCGLRVLPLDPSVPGDAATARGYVGVTNTAPGARRQWEPLRELAASGAAVLWIALSGAAKPQLARSMLHSAFLQSGQQAPSQEHLSQVLAALARTFGDPVATPALEAELNGTPAAPSRGPVTREYPGEKLPARSSWAGRLVLIACLAVGAVGAWQWYLHRGDDEPAQPVATAGSEVWVQLRVRVEADRTRQGGAWDLDSSAPEIRVSLHPRDETVLVGPCENNRVCEGVVNAARLVPGVPFRIAVDEMDYLLADREGAGWLWWRGGREETLRTRLGAVDVTVTVRRLAQQPAVAPAVAPPAVDAGAARPTSPRAVDAGAPRRNNSRTRTRVRAPVAAPPDHVPEDPTPEPTPLAPLNPF